MTSKEIENILLKKHGSFLAPFLQKNPALARMNLSELIQTIQEIISDEIKRNSKI